ncbi:MULTISPECIES: site-2 protease family protein [Sutcliffiella]|uniref:Site-2 protease family protein n=1 Tax=Sutcliffiella cohnii TaxID=33932 RepID=A0A223KWM8_9BACI|nr:MULTISPECIES: site-2 protease family protein [Sutcliffiella]AST93804.1 site-2 protease family protein [Sutcliffiella cohnii]WBL14995.1 site-2 protease family protein [Sutcliffiella sp. NC1]
MEGFLAFPLELIPFVAITLIFAFTLHEYAHAFVAYKFGDSTAAKQGRLTLSPMAHLDPLGTILIFLVGFGWAKPVPVNRFFFKRPRLAGVLVSIAGPLSNLFLAIIGAFLFLVLIKFGLYETVSATAWRAIETFFSVFVMLNIILFIFNLLPIPPLDGYRIIHDLVPNRVRPQLTKLEPFGMIFFLALVLIRPLYDVTIGLLFSTVYPTIEKGIFDFLATLLML